MTALLLAAALATAPSYEPERLLYAIAQVEQHKDDWLGGRYAITRAAWEETTRVSYHLSRNRDYCHAVARKRLALLALRLNDAGMVVTPYALACCWKLGWDGYLRENQRGWIDYGQRVANLYDDAK